MRRRRLVFAFSSVFACCSGLSLALVLLAGCGDDASAPADGGRDLPAADGAPADAGLGDGAADSSVGDGLGADAGGPTRPFRLGFTPFPYDTTTAAVDDVYLKLRKDADLYAYHTTSGVPWVEAAQGLPWTQYGQALRDTWTRHAAERRPSHAIYLGLTPLNDGRSGLAEYWGAQENMALPAPWSGYALDAPQVQAAYLAFCREAIEHYKPDYLAIGIEVNLLLENTPTAWPAYLKLHEAVYAALKKENPNLPIFATVTAVDLLPGFTSANEQTHRAALAELMKHSDYLALSLYPFMSSYLANPLPKGYLDDLIALAGGKPVVIAESGYPAQKTELKSFGLVFEGTESKQQAFVDQLLKKAEAAKMPFVVNFVLQDYDALWQKIGAGDADAVWRDTGLYDENGKARSALTTWRAALSRPYAP